MVPSSTPGSLTTTTTIMYQCNPTNESFQNKDPGVLNDIGALTDGEMGNKGPWVLKDIGGLSNGETGSGTSSRIEQKRAHQVSMDASEGEFFSNKKQAVQSVSDTAISTHARSNFSFWSNTSNYQSDLLHSSDSSRAPEPRWTYTFVSKNLFSLGDENVKSERSQFIDLLQDNSTVNLSMSHAEKDPSDLNAGTRGARISLAGECTSGHPFPLWNPPNTGEDSMNATSLGLTYGAGVTNVFSMGYNSAKGKKPINPIDNTINRVNGDCMLMSHQHSRGERNPYLMDQSLDTGNNYYKTGNQPYKENGNFMLIPSYKEAWENFPVGTTGNKDIGAASRIPTPSEVDITGNKDIAAASRIPTPSEVVLVEGTKGSEKKVKTTPMSSSNNFPANVKSLLLTGILDGVPVKYVSWDREKSVRGIIKGYGYLCGCKECKLSKNLSALEFERHAACKTRHPNNNIYFETGKSIFAVVQELKKTPPEMLFEAIQSITGSPINQKNFQTWKASFQAANRELHHIYTKNDQVEKPF